MFAADRSGTWGRRIRVNPGRQRKHMRVPHFAIKVARKLLTPLLPKAARLPFNYQLHRCAGSIEPELLRLRAICPGGGIAIDVGANVGLYAYQMARICSKVYAFEINEGVAVDLVAYNSEKIHVIHAGLSSDHGDATLYIPVLNGLSLHGWASLQPGNCPDTQVHITKPVHVQPLDSFSLSGVSFIKIDVESHEVEVLRGALKTISANRPVVLIEVKESNLEMVSSFFYAIDYREESLQALCGVKNSRENHIFVPLNRLADAVQSGTSLVVVENR